MENFTQPFQIVSYGWQIVSVIGIVTIARALTRMAYAYVIVNRKDGNDGI